MVRPAHLGEVEATYPEIFECPCQYDGSRVSHWLLEGFLLVVPVAQYPGCELLSTIVQVEG